MPLSNSPIDSTWKLTFDDEFNTLNTSHWGTNWLGAPGAITKPINSAEQAAYDPAQVSVSDGYLHLGTDHKTVTVGSTTYNMVGGMVQSNDHFQQAYGYFEARIFLPGSNGDISNWPAFWLDGQNWPVDGELDIMEGLSGQAGWHFHSPSGGPGASSSADFTGWHTYGALWEPGSVTYYYDGVEMGKITSGITSSPMYMILNNGVSDSIGGPTHVPSDMLVDYVHVYSQEPNAVAVAPEANYNGPGEVAGGGGTPAPEPPPVGGGILGDSLGNLLVGDSGSNTLSGQGGADTLNGGAGADNLIGGAGNDLYMVDSTKDIVNENGGSGTDTVLSSISFDLHANGRSVLGSIENLTLTGFASNGTGNDLNNTLIGDKYFNRLVGNGGNDTIDGGAGNDILTGGSGSDTFIRHALSAEGRDTIKDFHTGAGGDKLDVHDVLSGFVNGASNPNDFVHLTQSGGNTTVQIDANGAAGGHSYTSVAVLTGVTGVTVNELVNDGNIVLH
jgi:Ca2+-binding RTX toxin-like protein